MKKWLSAALLAGALLWPQQTDAAEQAFVDVTDAKQNHILLKLTSSNVIDDTVTHYLPLRGVTRGEMADVLSRAYKLYNVRPAAEFADVPTYHEHYEAIQALYRAGIVDGYEGNFNPDSVVKRAHVAKVLTNLLKLTPQKTTAFKDVPVNDANNQFVGALVKKGLTTGFEDGTFRPNQAVTKMQFATFTYRALYGKEPNLTNRKISSNTAYAPTKISAGNYRIPFLEGTQPKYIQYNKSGSSLDSNQFKLDQPGIWFAKDRIIAGVENSDYIFFNLDLRGATEFKVATGRDVEYYGDEVEYYPYKVTALFDQQVKTSKLSFTGVTKVSYTYTTTNIRADYYFKEGYGLIKMVSNGDTMWELVGYKQR